MMIRTAPRRCDIMNDPSKVFFGETLPRALPVMWRFITDRLKSIVRQSKQLAPA